MYDLMVGGETSKAVEIISGPAQSIHEFGHGSILGTITVQIPKEFWSAAPVSDSGSISVSENK